MNKRKIKLGFDAKRLFHNKEGLGSYARTLVSDLKQYYPEYDYYLFTPDVIDNGVGDYFKDNPNFKIIKANGRKTYWRTRGIVSDLQKHEIDIYFGLSNELPFKIEKSGIKTIVTIHDLIFKNFKSQFSWLDRRIYERKFRNAIYNSDHIIAPSQSTKKDVLKAYNIDSEKIKVIYQSVNPIFYGKEAFDNPEHFLFIGTLNDRKNLMLLVKAIHKMEADKRPKVVVVGEGKKYKHKVLSYIDKYALKPFFEFKGNVSDEVLVKLYQQSYALVFPSKYEGFGIPVIEAFTVGVPVIVSDSSSLPEISGQHGIVIDYNDITALTNALERLQIKENRLEKINGIKVHLNAFNPESICRKIHGIIKND